MSDVKGKPMQRYILQLVTTMRNGAQAFWNPLRSRRECTWASLLKGWVGGDISPPAPSTIGQGMSQGLVTPVLFQTGPESHVTASGSHREEPERHGEAEEGGVSLYLIKLIAAAMGGRKALLRA